MSRQKLFVCVDAKINSNKFYYMVENVSSGTFTAIWGRVSGAVTPDINALRAVCQKEKDFPISDWDKKVKQKSRKRSNGEMYKDVTHLFEEIASTPSKSNTASKPLKTSEDAIVAKLYETLQGYANHSIKQNYTVSTEMVTQKMVDEAQEILDEIKNHVQIDADHDKINQNLQDLFMVIPRKMQNVRWHLFDPITNKKSLSEAIKKIENEQSTLDVMEGQVQMLSKQIKSNDKSKDQVVKQLILLDQLGLEIREATNDEVSEVIDFMAERKHQCKKVYRVINKKTQGLFDSNLKLQTNNDVWMMFHGSRNQNWMNIINTGLLIRPSGAIHTGSMFGDGIYGARQARKAINYTDLRGSGYYTKGNDSKAFVGIFDFHVGNQKHIKKHNSSCYSLNYQKIQKEGNFDSVYAHGGIDLMNDEFIVYQSQQATVKYLVELG